MPSVIHPTPAQPRNFLRRNRESPDLDPAPDRIEAGRHPTSDAAVGLGIPRANRPAMVTRAPVAQMIGVHPCKANADPENADQAIEVRAEGADQTEERGVDGDGRRNRRGPQWWRRLAAR